MVRAKNTNSDKGLTTLQGQSVDLNELGKEGFTLLKDSTYGTVDDKLPTMLPELDATLDGGFPLGRILSVAAPAGVGKSNLGIQLTKVATDMGMIVVWLDVEGTSDKGRLEEMGVDTSKVLAKQPDPHNPANMTVEAVAESIEQVVHMFDDKNIPVLIIWDSVGQTPAASEIEGDYDNKQPGQQAKAITMALRKLTPILNGSKATLFAINQIRDQVGGMSFVKTYEFPGGKAFMHSLSTFYQLGKSGDLKQGQDYMGHKVKFTLKKSKTSKPFTKAEQLLYGGYGFNTEVNALWKAIELGIIKEKSGGSRGKLIQLADPETGEVKEFPKFDLLNGVAEEPEEYIDLVRPVFQAVLKEYFPKDFPPLHNKTVPAGVLPLLDGMEEYYEGLKNAPVVEEPVSEDVTE